MFLSVNPLHEYFFLHECVLRMLHNLFFEFDSENGDPTYVVRQFQEPYESWHCVLCE